MVDQRVSVDFLKPALTTTLPAQYKIWFKNIPVYIERVKNNNFKIEFQKEIDPKNLKTKLSLQKSLIQLWKKWLKEIPHNGYGHTTGGNNYFFTCISYISVGENKLLTILHSNNAIY